jgi:hypothetical protein
MARNAVVHLTTARPINLLITIAIHNSETVKLQMALDQAAQGANGTE